MRWHLGAAIPAVIRSASAVHGSLWCARGARDQRRISSTVSRVRNLRLIEHGARTTVAPAPTVCSLGSHRLLSPQRSRKRRPPLLESGNASLLAAGGGAAVIAEIGNWHLRSSRPERRQNHRNGRRRKRCSAASSVLPRWRKPFPAYCLRSGPTVKSLAARLCAAWC